jgi:hypothetical protein
MAPPSSLLSHFFIFLVNSPSSSFGPVQVAHRGQSCEHYGNSVPGGDEAAAALRGGGGR